MALTHSLRHMKTIVLWSRATDRIAFGFLCCFAFAAAVGGIIPAPIDAGQMRLADALLTASSLGFIWSGFRLARPFRPSQLWIIAEWIVVPIIWTGLVIGLAIWFSHLQEAFDYDLTHAMTTIIL